MKSKPLSANYLEQFRRITESNWRVQTVRSDVYGFQFQRGTRWNPGLSDKEVMEYQHVLGFEFSNDLTAFLREMNGTDLETINVYGNGGEPSATSLGVYSFPRDIDTVQDRIKDVNQNRTEITADLAEQGFSLPVDANLMPIYSHRYIVCTSDPSSSVVLSVVVRDVDAIVYAHSLEEYLEREFIVKAAR
jgi:hypothetical protein